MQVLRNPDGTPVQDANGQEREEGEEGGGVNGGREVKWSVPDGFKVAAEPETLDVSLIGSTYG